MKVTFRRSFARDLRKVKDQSILDRVRRAIEQVERASTTQEVRDLKKMGGAGTFYRIRVGDYRLGVVVEADQVDFVRCLPRRDIYRFFP
jgi:mRNA interferase RelE/StbE